MAWVSRVTPLVIVGVICTKYAVFRDMHRPAYQTREQDESLYQVSALAHQGGLRNGRVRPEVHHELLRAAQFQSSGTSGQDYSGRSGDFDQLLHQMLDSTDEVVRTAAGHLRTEANLKDCNGSTLTGLTWSAGEAYRDIAVCTIIRNEAATLPEWIAFHWLQGAGKFIIYDDGSIDNPTEALKPFIELGIVEYERLSPAEDLSGTEELQWEQMNACLRRVRATRRDHKLRYVTFLDLDEFMYPVNEGYSSVARLLADRFPAVPCLYVDRTYYGTSLRLRKPTHGLVISNYVMRSPIHEDGYPKVIVNLAPGGPPAKQVMLYSVHSIDTRDLEQPGEGQGEGEKEKKGQLAPPVCLERVAELRINHYSRSLEDYDLKIKTHYDGQARYQTNPLELFWERDRNDEFDDSAAVRYACQIKALLSKL